MLLLILFFKINFAKKPFSNTIRVPNGFDQDPNYGFVGPYLSPNCLQRLTADDKRKERVKICPLLVLITN